MNKLQEHILSVFKVYSELCEKHNLRYYAIGGTAIGAMRHRGFIPWDDDLDVAMPDVDYWKFLDIAREKLPEGYGLISHQDNSKFANVFCRVFEETTTCIIKDFKRIPETFHGIYIDIMPISGVPTRKKDRDKWLNRIYFDIRVGRRALLPLSASITTRNKAMWFFSRMLGIVKKKEYFFNDYYEQVKKHPFDESEYIGYTWSPGYGKLVFPKAWFNEHVFMEFEDTEIRCPKELDKYLALQFGDYMTPPKNPDERVGRHDAFVDYEHSYKDYQSGSLKIPNKNGTKKENSDAR